MMGKAYYDPDTNRYFAEIMYTGREGRENGCTL